jgi:Zn finger protein HypA/HybF involved in hydrogenase expression
MLPPQAHPTRSIYCLNCGYSHVVPTSCGNRFCPICSSKRFRVLRRFMQFVIRSAKFRPGYHWRHWILTVPSHTDPGAAAKELLKSFRRLRQRKFWRLHTTGGFAVVEFTHHRGLWHVHLHLAIFAGFIPVLEFRQEWAKVSSGRYVRLGNCPPDRFAGYLTKYLTSDKISPSDQVFCSNAFRKKRLFLTFGFAYNLRLPRVLTPFACPSCRAVEWTIDGSRAVLSVINRHGYSNNHRGPPPWKSLQT